MGGTPNIVVVMSDQHRADLMGIGGGITPNLDRLAAEGTTFTRTTCQGPLCMPARASFVTERYVRDHGVYDNWSELASTWPTYLHALREAGYHTALVGKAHLYRQEEHPADHIDELAPLLHALGFAEVHETGDKFYGHTPNRYVDFLAARALRTGYDRHLADHSYQGEGETGRGATKRVPMWDATPAPVPLDAYIDAWHGAEAARWIERFDRREPFFLFVGFPGPHDPWDAPAAAVDRIDLDRVPMPRSTRRPTTSGAGAYGRMLKAFLHLSDSDTMTDDAILAMRRAYLGAVNVIDEGVGRIVDALAATGRLDDTWVVYTSDHGEMGGDHGLMSKCVFYEAAVRVPLILRAPGGAGGGVVDDRLVEQVDVPATIRAIAGAPPIDGSAGVDLLAPQAPARTVTVTENWGFAAFETDRYTLVVDEDEVAPCQLFDRHEDPAEDENVVADPYQEGVVEELMERHVRPFFATPPVRPHPSPFKETRSS